MKKNHDLWHHDPTSIWLYVYTESWREGHRELSTPLYSASSEDSHRLRACVCAHSCSTLCDPMDCSPPGSSVHGIFQARILEQVAISYSRGSSWPRDGSNLHLLSSCIGRQILYLFATWEALIQTAAAKSLQSCPTLLDPIDGSPPGFPVPGILQARTLEWVAISFSNAWKWKVKVKSFSRIRLLATPWTAAYQAPLSTGFSRQEYWSGVPLPSSVEQ